MAKDAGPTVRVLVAGTGKSRAFTDAQRDTAQRLGVLLSQHRCGLVTGGWPGVDDVVARAFADGIQRAGLPLEDYLVQVVRDGATPAFGAGDLMIVHARSAEWTEAIERCDAIVLIGGVGGTRTTGMLGIEAGRLVLPLADTGGDAMEMYLHMLEHWDDAAMAPVTRKAFQTLSRPAPTVVDQLPALLATLRQFAPHTGGSR
jgi:predicted Rossmann-fold nucleotide-binding protein